MFTIHTLLFASSLYYRHPVCWQAYLVQGALVQGDRGLPHLSLNFLQHLWYTRVVTGSRRETGNRGS
ncbi:unnamed protein product [Caretta caretta]